MNQSHHFSANPDLNRNSGQNFELVQVAVNAALYRLFDYLPPETKNCNEYPLGSLVTVPFGNRKIPAVVVGHRDLEAYDGDKNKLKRISQLVCEQAIKDQNLRQAQWLADYYHHPLGEVLFHFLPNTVSDRSLTEKGITPKTSPYIGKSAQINIKGLGLAESGISKAPKQQELLSFLIQNKQAPLSLEQLKKAGYNTATFNALVKKDLVDEQVQPYEPAQSAAIQVAKQSQQALSLNDEQKSSLQTISDKLGGFAVIALDGVTGSGKTEVYLQAISKIIEQGKQALVLVPEIGLTPQTIQRFANRFDGEIAILHSGLNDKERHLAQYYAREGKASIVIGTRSAIFTPFAHLGLIIVDEEHDDSYKQQDGFRYSARDFAVFRAQKEAVCVVLGSATLSLETLNNADNGRYLHCKLTERASNAQLPTINFTDIRNQETHDGLHQSSIDAIRDSIGASKQSMVFINRRGFSPLLLCHDCGWHADCPSCDAKMTIHQANARLICHHCGHQQSIPPSCPRCHSHKLVYRGSGTERCVQSLRRLFPDTTILQMDRDTITTRNKLEHALTQINSGEPLIVVGTQMLVKGHHFPNLDTVVVMDSDQGLVHPDFRAIENTFQTLTQVAGRAGRVSGENKAKVLIQTHMPDHPLFERWATGGYQALASHLLRERRELKLPPNSYQALVRADANNPSQPQQFLKQLHANLASTLASEGQNQQAAPKIVGPMPAIMEKRAGRFRWLLLLASENRKTLHRALSNTVHLVENSKIPSGLRLKIDVDPIEF